jgi:hypothetical protein
MSALGVDKDDMLTYFVISFHDAYLPRLRCRAGRAILPAYGEASTGLPPARELLLSDQS